jgi:SAM-dependent methyltransferase
VSVLDPLLSQPLVYRLWQAPFTRQKLEPFLAHTELTQVKRVLDVGCGPGTNAGLFAHADYLGLDWNDSYIRYARRRHGGQFVTADARTFTAEPGQVFDCILVNSLLHHLDDDNVRSVLKNLSSLLADGGAIHVLELVLPADSGPALVLARLDRGDWARPLEAWRGLFAEAFTIEVFEPYVVGGLGVPLWHMVYVKGRRPR